MSKRTRISPLTIELGKLIENSKKGLSPECWRDFVLKRYRKNPDLPEFAEPIIALANRVWEGYRPRKTGLDLFQLAGVQLPEYFTATATGFLTSFLSGNEATDEDIDEDVGYIRIHAKHASVRQAMEDAQIKTRKALEASEAAGQAMRVADELRRRAKGRMDAFVRDVVDAPIARAA